MTLKQCRYFTAIAEHGGIAAAARALNISQPAVAQAIDKLEHNWGFQLFNRYHARGMELTPQGHAFLVSCERLLQQANQTAQDAEAIAAGQTGTLRLACFHTIAPFYLTSLIHRHNQQRPEIKIVASELRQDEILVGLKHAEFDLALTYDMFVEGEDLLRLELAKLKPFVLLREDHPLATRSAIALSEIADEPYVLFDGPSSREYFTGLLAQHHIEPDIRFRAKSIESARSAVADGFGFALAVMRPAHDETYVSKRVKAVEIEDSVEKLPIILCVRQSLAQNPVISGFVDCCRDYFETLE
ncbi:MAG: LysR family transcriptional regulator [Pseudomonadota bacterium]